MNMKKRNIRLENNRYKKTIDYLNALKDVPCFDCGIKYPPCAMDFDHRNPSEKKFSIGNSHMANIATLKREIEKCDIVCANCHRVRTAKQRIEGIFTNSFGRGTKMVKFTSQLSLDFEKIKIGDN